MHQKLTKENLKFTSIKEIRWCIEILGYSLIPPFYQNIVKEKDNYPIKMVLTLYDYILLNEVTIFLTSENRQAQPVKISDSKVIMI